MSNFTGARGCPLPVITQRTGSPLMGAPLLPLFLRYSLFHGFARLYWTFGPPSFRRLDLGQGIPKKSILVPKYPLALAGGPTGSPGWRSDHVGYAKPLDRVRGKRRGGRADSRKPPSRGGRRGRLARPAHPHRRTADSRG